MQTAHLRATSSAEFSKQAIEIAAELRRNIQGEVLFDSGSRALYATDLSVYRQVPIGVVVPKSIEDVVATAAVCRHAGVPILGRGCGTSLAGQCCNVAIVIDFSKYLNQVKELNINDRYAIVEPGTICDVLRSAAYPHQLTYAAAPATHAYCTLGGMIGNNSCGAETFSFGKTSEQVQELEVLTYDGTRMTVGPTSDIELQALINGGGRRGEIYSRLRSLRDRYQELIRERYPRIPRRVSGYNLDQLLPESGFNVARALVGTESTCALILSAKLRLVPNPPHRALVVIGYPEIFEAADDVPRISALEPRKLEAFHVHVLENMIRKHRFRGDSERLPPGRAWLLAEFRSDDPGELEKRISSVAKILGSRSGAALGVKVLRSEEDQEWVWEIREAGVAASRVPGVENAWPSWEDSAVPPDKLGPYLRDLHRLIGRFGYNYTMFGHFGDGCVHARIGFDLKSGLGVKDYRRFLSEAADLVCSYGGSLSGEHGDGQARAEFLPKMFGPELVQAFREFKAIWDPRGMMNPGKVVDPYPVDTNLRLGPDYHPKPVLTYFKYPEDHGSFAEASERCFGVGKCRRIEGGTMCPSFRVTRSERHTTRGRAHLLFEMLRGDVIQNGWRDENVRDSLDLCLSCKGCKGDCPVAVDMATYKAEFLAHYYKGRLRPLKAYAMGWIFRWARIASRFPGLANFLSQTPPFANLLKAAVRIAPQRDLPRFAKMTFREWFKRRPGRETGRRKVLLWPDTFNNHFYPKTAIAAVEVLESAGFEVELPPDGLCCGRPLYDFGMLDLAQAKLKQIIEALRPALEEGTPIVGLEPSCVAVFRDELGNLFPTDEDARRLGRQTFLLSEFLEREGYEPPQLRASGTKAIVQGHCHQKAIIGMDSDKRILDGLGIEARVLNSGCCGMAGSFGFEAEHYDVSMGIGEQVLLPTIRKAPKDELLIANGFSCREQIRQGTGRQALHLAEAIRLALPKAETEDSIEPRPTPSRRYGRLIAASAAIGLLAWLALSRQRIRA